MRHMVICLPPLSPLPLPVKTQERKELRKGVENAKGNSQADVISPFIGIFSEREKV